MELAAPDQFIPELPGWQDRSLFIATEGKLTYYHYDPYPQALSKIERGHRQDAADVSDMLRSGLVRPERLLELFEQIEPVLYRYPAIDPLVQARRGASRPGAVCSVSSSLLVVQPVCELALRGGDENLRAGLAGGPAV